MAKRKVFLATSTLIIIALFFFGLIFFVMSSMYQPGVLLSCETGEFVKFVSIGTPMKMVFLPGTCSGKILITNKNEGIVCEKDDYNSEEDDVVRIRCPDLKNYKGQSLKIEFETYSVEYGNHTGIVEKIYGQENG